MSKLLNCVLRWRHLTWPGDLTWYDLGPKFLHKMRKGWMNSYANFRGAARRHFSAICEKPMGGEAHMCAPGRARVNRRLTAYLRILWENEQYIACRGTFNICFSTTCILVLPTVFEQHDAEVPEVRVYTCCRFWHWLGDWARVKNWIFVTSCYVMASVHIWNVKYNFNRMFCAVSPQVLRTAFY